MDDSAANASWPTPLSLATLRAVCARHRLPPPERVPTPWIGATSSVYPLADVVVKVPYPGAESVAALRRDAAVMPIALAAGAATPRLVALDDSGDLLPVPYVLIQRIEGSPLPRPACAEAVDGMAWRELGRQLALVHARVAAEPLRPLLRSFVQTPEVDPRPWAAALARAGRLAAEDAAWLAGLLDRLAPAALAPSLQAFCHGDVNAGNALRESATGRVVLIDWAGAGWLDPVWDFAGVPLAVVPAMLAGHREVAPLIGDETAEARILWCHLQLVLDRMVRDASPGEDVERTLRAARVFLAATGALR